MPNTRGLSLPDMPRKRIRPGALVWPRPSDDLGIKFITVNGEIVDACVSSITELPAISCKDRETVGLVLQAIRAYLRNGGHQND